MSKLIDFLRDHGITYREHGSHHHVTMGWLGVDCPYCSKGSGKFKMGLSLNGRAANCWTCGSFRIGTVLAALTGKKVDFTADWCGPPKKIKRSQVVVYPDGTTDLRQGHKAYLKTRGFDPDKLVNLWGIWGTEQSSRAPWRIIIPVFYEGIAVSWTSRSICPGVNTRYKNAKPNEEITPIHDLLYGLDYIRHTALIHEGPTDVWRMGPGAIATFGVNVTPAQIEKLSKIPRRIICFDNETTAQNRASKLCNILGSFPGETFRVRIESGKDVAEADPEEVLELRKFAFGEEP